MSLGTVYVTVSSVRYTSKQNWGHRSGDKTGLTAQYGLCLSHRAWLSRPVVPLHLIKAFMVLLLPRQISQEPARNWTKCKVWFLKTGYFASSGQLPHAKHTVSKNSIRRNRLGRYHSLCFHLMASKFLLKAKVILRLSGISSDGRKARYWCYLEG